jgi:hypothetical protein
VDAGTYRKYDNRPPRALLLYVFVQFVALNVAAVAFFFQSGDWPAPARAAAAVGLVVTLASLGGLLDRRPWATRLEVARLAGAAAAALFLWSAAPPAASAFAAAAALGLLWLLRLRPVIRHASDVPRAA